MHFTALVLVAAAVPAAFVGAQSSTASAAAPTSTAGISPCVLTCVSQAATSAGCSSITDLQCLCTSSDFQTTAAACLQSDCSSDDLAAGQALQQQECASISGTSSATGTAVSTLSLSSVASSAESSASSAASSAISTISSAISSRSSGIGSILSSATSAASSAVSSAANSSAASSKSSFGVSAVYSAAVGIFGIAVGALLV